MLQLCYDPTGFLYACVVPIWEGGTFLKMGKLGFRAIGLILGIILIHENKCDSTQ